MLSLKIALTLVFSLTAVGFAATARWPRDTAATHPSLATAEQPALISGRDFYADTRAEWAFRPSYNDRYFAWRATRKIQQVVLVKDPSNNREAMRLTDVDYYF